MRNEFVARLLQGWLNTYLDRVSPEQVQWSLRRGSLDLSHARLRPRTLLTLQTKEPEPLLKLVDGQLGRLSLTLPWFHGWRTSLALQLTDVVLELCWDSAVNSSGQAAAPAETTVASTAGAAQSASEECTAHLIEPRLDNGESPNQLAENEPLIGASSPRATRRRQQASEPSTPSITLYLLERLGLFACSFRVEISRLSANISVSRNVADTVSAPDASAASFDIFRVQWQQLSISSPMDGAEAFTLLQSMRLEEPLPSREHLTEWLRTEGTVCKYLDWQALEVRYNNQTMVQPMHLKVLLIFNVYAASSLWIWFQMTPLCVNIGPWLSQVASQFLPRRADDSSSLRPDEHKIQHTAAEDINAQQGMVVPFWRMFFDHGMRVFCFGMVEALQIRVESLTDLLGHSDESATLQAHMALRPLYLQMRYGDPSSTLMQMGCTSLELGLDSIRGERFRSLSISEDASAPAEHTSLFQMSMAHTEKQDMALDLCWTSMELTAEEHNIKPVSRWSAWWPWSRTHPRRADADPPSRPVVSSKRYRDLRCSIGACSIQLSENLVSSWSSRQASDTTARPATGAPTVQHAPQTLVAARSQGPETSAASENDHNAALPVVVDSFLLQAERFQLMWTELIPGTLVCEGSGIGFHLDHRLPHCSLTETGYVDVDLIPSIIATSWQTYRTYLARAAENQVILQHDRPRRTLWLSTLCIERGRCLWTRPMRSKVSMGNQASQKLSLVELTDTLSLTSWLSCSTQPLAIFQDTLTNDERPVVIATSIPLRMSVPTLVAFWLENKRSFQRDAHQHASTSSARDESVQHDSETRPVWPLKYVECVSLQIRMDWAGSELGPSDHLTISGRDIELYSEMRPSWMPVGCMVLFQVANLTLSMAAQASPFLECSDFRAKLPLPAVLYTGVSDIQTAEMIDINQVHVQLAHLVCRLSPAALAIPLRQISDLWRHLGLPIGTMDTAVFNETRETAAHATWQREAGTRTSQLEWLVSLSNLEVVYALNPEESSALYLQTLQFADTCLGPLLRLGARLDAEEDLVTTLCRFGHPGEAIAKATAVRYRWQPNTRRFAEVSNCLLQLENIRLTISEEKSRRLWSAWLLLRSLLRSMPWVQSQPRSESPVADNPSSIETGSKVRNTSEAQQHQELHSTTRQTTRSETINANRKHNTTVSSQNQDIPTNKLKLHIVCVQLQLTAKEPNEHLVLHLDEIEAKDILQPSFQLELHQTQAWRLSNSELGAQALTNQVDWTLSWQANSSALQLRIPTVHTLGTVSDLNVVTDVVTWVRELQDEIYRALLPAIVEGARFIPQIESKADTPPPFADASDTIPHGHTQVHCARFFFTLWPRENGHDPQKRAEALETLQSNRQSDAVRSAVDASGELQVNVSPVLADLVANRLAIDYRYYGLRESLHFQAERIRLRTEMSTYLGSLGELVLTSVLKVRYECFAPSKQQPVVQIQFDGARVFLDWPIIQRIWNEFSNAETSSEQTSAPESIHPETCAEPDGKAEASAIAWQLHIQTGRTPSLLVLPLPRMQQMQDASSAVAPGASRARPSQPVVGLCFCGEAVFWDRPDWFRITGYEQAYPRSLVLSSCTAEVSELAAYLDDQGRWHARRTVVQVAEEADGIRFEQAQRDLYPDSSLERLSRPAARCQWPSLDHRLVDPTQQQTMPANARLERANLSLQSSQVQLRQCLVQHSLQCHVEKHLRWENLHVHVDAEAWNRFPHGGASKTSTASAQSSEPASSSSSSSPKPETTSEMDAQPLWYQIDGRKLSASWRILSKAQRETISGDLNWFIRADELRIRLLQHVVPSITTRLLVSTRCRAHLATDLVLEPVRLSLEYQSRRRGLSPPVRRSSSGPTAAFPEDASVSAPLVEKALLTDQHQDSEPAEQTKIHLACLDAVRFNLTPHAVAALVETAQSIPKADMSAVQMPAMNPTPEQEATSNQRSPLKALELVNKSGISLHLGELEVLAPGQTRRLDYWPHPSALAIRIEGQESRHLPWSSWRRLLQSTPDTASSVESKTPPALDPSSWTDPKTSRINAFGEYIAAQGLQWPNLALVCTLYRSRSTLSGPTGSRPLIGAYCVFESPLYWENQTPLTLVIWAGWDDATQSCISAPVARLEAAPNPLPENYPGPWPQESTHAERLLATNWRYLELVRDENLMQQPLPAWMRWSRTVHTPPDAPSPRDYRFCPRCNAASTTRRSATTMSTDGITSVNDATRDMPITSLWSWALALAKGTASKRELWVSVHPCRKEDVSADSLERSWCVLVSARILGTVPTETGSLMPMILMTLQAPLQMRNALSEPVFVEKRVFLLPGWLYRSCCLDTLKERQCTVAAATLVSDLAMGPLARANASRHARQPAAGVANESVFANVPSTKRTEETRWQPALWVLLQLPEAFSPPPVRPRIWAHQKIQPGCACSTTRDAIFWRLRRFSNNLQRLYRKYPSTPPVTSPPEPQYVDLDLRVNHGISRSTRILPNPPEGVFEMCSWIALLSTRLHSIEQRQALAAHYDRLQSQTAGVVASDRGALEPVPCPTSNSNVSSEWTYERFARLDSSQSPNDDHDDHAPSAEASSTHVTGTPISVQYRCEHADAVREILLSMPVLWCSLWSASRRTWMHYGQSSVPCADWFAPFRQEQETWPVEPRCSHIPETRQAGRSTSHPLLSTRTRSNMSADMAAGESDPSSRHDRTWHCSAQPAETIVANGMTKFRPQPRHRRLGRDHRREIPGVYQHTPPFVLSSCPWLVPTRPAITFKWRVDDSAWSQPFKLPNGGENGLVIPLDLVQRHFTQDTAPKMALPAFTVAPGHRARPQGPVTPRAADIASGDVCPAGDVASAWETSSSSAISESASRSTSATPPLLMPLLTDARWPWLYQPSECVPGSPLESVRVASSIPVLEPTRQSAKTERPASSSMPTDIRCLSTTSASVTNTETETHPLPNTHSQTAVTLHHRQTEIVVCQRPLRYPLEHSQLLVVYPRYRIVNLWPQHAVLVWPTDQNINLVKPHRWSVSRWLSRRKETIESAAERAYASPAFANDLPVSQGVFHLDPGAMATLHWPAGTERPGLRLAFAAPGCPWSGLVSLNASKSHCLRLWHASKKACFFPRIHTAAGTGDLSQVHLVTILPPHPFLIPYRICNQTIERIRFVQRLGETKRCSSLIRSAEDLPNAARALIQHVDPLSDCPYAWDEPQAEPILDLWMDGYGYIGGFLLDQESYLGKEGVAGGHISPSFSGDRHANVGTWMDRNPPPGRRRGNRAERPWMRRKRWKRESSVLAVQRWLGRHSFRKIIQEDQMTPILLARHGYVWKVPVPGETIGNRTRRSFRIYVERHQATLCLVIAECERDGAVAIRMPRQNTVDVMSPGSRGDVGETQAIPTMPSKETVELASSVTTTAAAASRVGLASGLQWTISIPELGVSLLQNNTGELREIREVLYAAAQQLVIEWWHARVTDRIDGAQQTFAADQFHQGALSLHCAGLQVDHNVSLRLEVPPSQFGVAFSTEPLDGNATPDNALSVRAASCSETPLLRAHQTFHDCSWGPWTDPESRPSPVCNHRFYDTEYAAPWARTRYLASASSIHDRGRLGLLKDETKARVLNQIKEMQRGAVAWCLRVQFESSTAGAHTFLRLHSGQLACGRTHLRLDASLAVQLVDWVMACQRLMSGTENAVNERISEPLVAGGEPEPISLIWTRFIDASEAFAVSLPSSFEGCIAPERQRQDTAQPEICSEGSRQGHQHPSHLFKVPIHTENQTSGLAAFPPPGICDDSVVARASLAQPCAVCCRHCDWGSGACLANASSAISRTTRQALEAALLRGLPSVQQVQQRSEQSLRLLFHDVVWRPLTCAISVRSDPANLGALLRYRGSDWPRLLAITLTPLMNVQDASIWLRELTLDGVFETISDWEHHVIRHYQQQLSRVVWKVLGSAEWLGNPARYIRSLYQASVYILRGVSAQLHRHQFHGALAVLVEMSLGSLAHLGFLSFDALSRIASSMQRAILISLITRVDPGLTQPEMAGAPGVPEARGIKMVGWGADLTDASMLSGGRASDVHLWVQRRERYSGAAVSAWEAFQQADVWQRLYLVFAMPLVLPLQIVALCFASTRDVCGQFASRLPQTAMEGAQGTHGQSEGILALRPPRTPSLGPVTAYNLEDAMLGTQLWQMLVQSRQTSPVVESYRFCCRYAARAAVLCTSKHLWCFVAQVEGSLTSSQSMWSWRLEHRMKWDDIVLFWSTAPEFKTLCVLALAPESLPLRSRYRMSAASWQHALLRVFETWTFTWLRPSRRNLSTTRRARRVHSRSLLALSECSSMYHLSFRHFAQEGWRIVSIPLANALVTRALAQRLRAEWHRGICSHCGVFSRAVLQERWWWWSSSLSYGCCPWHMPTVRFSSTPADESLNRDGIVGTGRPASRPDRVAKCPPLRQIHSRMPSGWADALYAYDASTLFPCGVYGLSTKK